MRLRSAVLPLAFALSFGTSIAPLAHAQSDGDRATARSLGQEGQQAFDNKDYATAEDRFRRADKMVHAPTLMLGLARALAAEGKYVEAQESYNRIVREGLPPGGGDAFKRAIEAAQKEVDTVAPKVGAVTITIKSAAGADVPDPQVVLDEHPINSASLGVRRAIDPGTHVLRVTAAGFKPAETKFTTIEGGAVDEPLVLEQDLSAPPPTAVVPATTPGATAAAVSSSDVGAPQPSNARKVAPFVAFGVGGVGLVLGAVTGVLAIGKHSTLSDECKNGCGPGTPQDDLSSYHTMGTLSTVGFIVAGVGAAAGVVLLVTEPKTAPTTGLHVVPTLGLGSLGAAGTF
jgi:Tetratricopeptide repeat